MMLGGPPRDNKDARAKVYAEGKCRNCGRTDEQVPLEFAHVSGRRFDEPKPCKICNGTGSRFESPCAVCDGRGVTKTRYVHPDDGIPLCGPHADPRSCHAKDHKGEIDILPLLTVAEQLRAVKHFEGIENARVRLAPSAYRSAA